MKIKIIKPTNPSKTFRCDKCIVDAVKLLEYNEAFEKEVKKIRDNNTHRACTSLTPQDNWVY